MPPREEEIDHVCQTCGLVTMGPHKGKHVRVPDNPKDWPITYYGAPISHTYCEDCGMPGAKEHAKKHALLEKRRQGGHATSEAGYNTAAHREQVRAERNAARAAEAAERKSGKVHRGTPEFNAMQRAKALRSRESIAANRARRKYQERGRPKGG